MVSQRTRTAFLENDEHKNVPVPIVYSFLFYSLNSNVRRWGHHTPGYPQSISKPMQTYQIRYASQNEDTECNIEIFFNDQIAQDWRQTHPRHRQYVWDRPWVFILQSKKGETSGQEGRFSFST